MAPAAPASVSTEATTPGHRYQSSKVTLFWSGTAVWQPMHTIFPIPLPLSWAVPLPLTTVSWTSGTVSVVATLSSPGPKPSSHDQPVFAGSGVDRQVDSTQSPTAAQ